jgi:hypothetical protein
MVQGLGYRQKWWISSLCLFDLSLMIKIDFAKYFQGAYHSLNFKLALLFGPGAFKDHVGRFSS